jgi:hypothetical protein
MHFWTAGRRQKQPPVIYWRYKRKQERPMNTMTTTNRQPARWMRDAFRNRLTGATDIAAVVVPAVFVLGTAALESVQNGYSRITDTVSELVWGSSGWFEAMLFCLNGLFLLLFALRLYKASKDAAGKAGVAMLALAGLSFLTIAVCPTLAPGAEPSFTSRVHEYTARGISAIFPLACLLLALSWKRSPAYKTIANVTIIFGAIGLALNLVGLLYVTGDLEWIGALERAIILNGFAWLAVLGLHFCHTSHGMRTPCCVHINMASRVYRLRPALKDMAGRLLPESRIRIPVYTRDGCCGVIPQHAASTDNMHITGRSNEHIYKR